MHCCCSMSATYKVVHLADIPLRRWLLCIISPFLSHTLSTDIFFIPPASRVYILAYLSTNDPVTHSWRLIKTGHSNGMSSCVTSKAAACDIIYRSGSTSFLLYAPAYLCWLRPVTHLMVSLFFRFVWTMQHVGPYLHMLSFVMLSFVSFYPSVGSLSSLINSSTCIVAAQTLEEG